MTSSDDVRGTREGSGRVSTPLGEIDEEDWLSLEENLSWYMKYGCLPSLTRRETNEAKMDYARQYERYVGYLFEKCGYSVEYRGILCGVEDGGVDLVAKAPRHIRYVQCKRWLHDVNSDVVSRVHGAVERFSFHEGQGRNGKSRMKIKGVIVTSGGIENEALELARHLGIAVKTLCKYQPYPSVKCKVLACGMGKCLLPFTQGYDKIKMDVRKGDRFFYHVRDAYEAGFYYPPYHRKLLSAIIDLKP